MNMPHACQLDNYTNVAQAIILLNVHAYDPVISLLGMYDNYHVRLNIHRPETLGRFRFRSHLHIQRLSCE